MVQKRLLVRYKDRNSAPLNGLDVLMRGTYEQIVQETEKVEDSQKRLRVAARRLRVTLRLLLFLMKLKFKLDSESYDILVSSFCVSHLCEYETEEQGWEEVVDASLVHLLRTVLSSTSGSTFSVVETRLEMPSNTNRLKKHIAVVADRLSKGCSLRKSSSSSSSMKKKKKVLSKSVSVAVAAPTKTSEPVMRKKKVRMSMVVKDKSQTRKKIRIKLKRKKRKDDDLSNKISEGKEEEGDNVE